jgi:hypothetical protein
MSTDYEPGEWPPRPSEFKNWSPSPYCPHFIEKFLLAIIDAHPLPPGSEVAKDDEHARQVRLSRALEALLGVSRPTGRKSNYDLPVLMQIARERIHFDFAREYQEDLVSPPEKLVDVDAFQKVMKRLVGNTMLDADFQAEYVRLLKKYSDDRFKRYALEVLEPGLQEHDEEVAMHDDLQELAALLAKWKIRTQVDPVSLGLMSLTNERAVDPFFEKE